MPRFYRIRKKLYACVCVFLLLLVCSSIFTLLTSIQARREDNMSEIEFHYNVEFSQERTPVGATETVHQARNYSTLHIASNTNRTVHDYVLHEIGSVKHISKLQDLQIKYDSFSIVEPRFISLIDRTLFYRDRFNFRDLGSPLQSRLHGAIAVIRNGTIHKTFTCGWRTNVTSQQLVTPLQKNITERYKILCPILVPDSDSFQHFIDGVLPKIVQTFAILNTFPDAKVMLFPPKDDVIKQLIKRLTLTSRVVYYTKDYYAADYIINTCITPPLHPKLWAEGRAMLMSPYQSAAQRSRDLVVLLVRDGSNNRNEGRIIRNAKPLYEFFQTRYGRRLVIFRGQDMMRYVTDIFRDAKVIVGVHGGAFYNMIFSHPGTHIVEILPTDDRGRAVPSYIAHTIVWQMASVLGHTYWRLPHTPEDRKGDVSVDIERMRKVLDIVDQEERKRNL